MAQAVPSGTKGINMIFPRPEITVRMAYAPGIQISPEMDLLFFSGLTVYPWEVDPWNPGTFKLPTDGEARSRMATENLEQVLKAAGIEWTHIVNNVNYRSPGEGAIDFGEHWGNYRPCSTSLRVTDTGIPGANFLHQLNAVAPRKTMTAMPGVVRGIEPILHRQGVALRDLPAAPAMRVSSDVDLVFLSGITPYPMNVDPWNPGTFKLPADLAAQEKMLGENVDRMLKAAGIGWQNIVLLAVTGEIGPNSGMHARLGEWRPCRTLRAVDTGIPGVRVICELTAVAPRQAQGGNTR